MPKKKGKKKKKKVQTKTGEEKCLIARQVEKKL
jgi:hypothetical protein